MAQLSDEVINVVSGFQVAGFPHVVGCLWPSKDRFCFQAASGLYKSLLQRGDMKWEDRDVALAAREAVMAVQMSERKPRPLTWAQSAHYGA